jgi:starch synthase
MRYGCIPIVRATGGLADTVEGYQPGGWGTGFVFRPLTPRALAAAVQNAFEVYRDRRRWRALQRRAMRRDFSWKQSALRYLDLYEQMRLSPAAGA